MPRVRSSSCRGPTPAPPDLFANPGLVVGGEGIGGNERVGEPDVADGCALDQQCRFGIAQDELGGAPSEIGEQELRRWWMLQAAALRILMRPSHRAFEPEDMNLGRFGEGEDPEKWQKWMAHWEEIPEPPKEPTLAAAREPRAEEDAIRFASRPVQNPQDGAVNGGSD